MEILKQNNLELKISKFTEQMKAYEAKAAQGQNYGKLDLSLSGMRSNDAGNVFGFKLKVERLRLVILVFLNLICQVKQILYL